MRTLLVGTFALLSDSVKPVSTDGAATLQTLRVAEFLPDTDHSAKSAKAAPRHRRRGTLNDREFEKSICMERKWLVRVTGRPSLNSFAILRARSRSRSCDADRDMPEHHSQAVSGPEQVRVRAGARPAH